MDLTSNAIALAIEKRKYLTQEVTLNIGGRTMPWMVTFFGILVIPLGFVSVFLIISQPLSVGAWCSICLLSAIVMLPMIPLQIDEVIAMWQHMVQRKQKGDSLRKVF